MDARQILDLGTIPPEVYQAERVLVEFMERNCSGPWEFGRVCSRDHAAKLNRIVKATFETIDT